MQIGFPNLNIFFNIDNIAFEIFGISVYWYGVLFVFAYIIALILFRINSGLYSIKWEDAFLTSAISIFIGIIGARIYYVLFNLEYYSNNILQIFNIRSGGLAIYGGLIFGVLGIYIMSKILKYDFINMLDFIVPYVALAQCIGRLGNFFNVEAYGYTTDVFWKMRIFMQDAFMDVHPTFIYEMIITLSIFTIIYLLRKKRQFKGQPVLIYLIIYGLGRFIVEDFRADSLMIGTFKVSQVLSLFIFLIAISIYVYRFIKFNKKTVN